MANREQSASAYKRKTADAADQSESAKRTRTHSGTPSASNELHKISCKPLLHSTSSLFADWLLAATGLRVTIRPIGQNHTAPAPSSTSSSALSTPTGTPDPTNASARRRRRPIRFHVPQPSTSSSTPRRTAGGRGPADLAPIVHEIRSYPPVNGHFLELQNGKCLKSEYRYAQKCANCMNKHTTSMCLFQGSRVFVVPNPPFNQIERSTPVFFASHQTQMPNWELRTIFNRAMKDEERESIAAAVSFGLRRTLVQAERHAKQPNTIYRTFDGNDERGCVYCGGPFFLSYWLCGGCGREYCDACHGAIKDCLPSLGDPPIATDPESALKRASDGLSSSLSKITNTAIGADSEQSRAELRYLRDLDRLPNNAKVHNGYISDLRTQKLLTCSKRRLHGADHFLPVTACSESYLASFLRECDRLATNNRQSIPDQVDMSSNPQDQPLYTTAEEATRLEGQRPTVITGVGERFEVDWTPESFCKAFNRTRSICRIQDAVSLRTRDTVVADFFLEYGRPHKRETVWTIDVSMIHVCGSYVGKGC